MRSTLAVITMAILCVAVTSCTKEGLGGKTTVVAKLSHHHHVIVSQADHPDTVFVKFDAKESAGTDPSDYDTFFVGEAGEDHVHMPGFKPGDYFLFGVGVDTAINQRVKGGVAVKIKRSDKNEEINVDIPVTED